MDTKFVVLGLLLLLSAGFADTIFSDGFEDGTFDAWDSVANGHVIDTDNNTGNYSAYDEGVMGMTMVDFLYSVDLSGYSSVNLSAYAKGGDLGLFICTDNTTALCEPVDSNSLTGDWAYYSAATSNATFLNVNSTIWIRLVASWGFSYIDDVLLTGELAGGATSPAVISAVNATTGGVLISENAPVNAAGVIDFNADWTDADGDNQTMYVCNATGFTHGVGCTGGLLCSSVSLNETPISCSYTANSQSGGDPAINWTAYIYLDDTNNASSETTVVTFTNHIPTVSGALASDGVSYAVSNLVTNTTAMSKNDADEDNTTYIFEFLRGVTVLQNYSTSSTYNCSGHCVSGDNITVNAVAVDAHGLLSTPPITMYIPIINSPPVIGSGNSSSNATNPVDETEDITFSVDWTDDDGGNVTMYVCNSSGFGFGVGCVGEELCNSSSTGVSPASCDYEADSQSSGDNATTWNVYIYLDDGTESSAGGLTVDVYTNHFPTITGTVSFAGVVYAGGTITLVTTNQTKADADGDTTIYLYRFLEADDMTVLQDWSTTSTYACATCNIGDVINVDVLVRDEHSAVSTTYLENHITISNSLTGGGSGSRTVATPVPILNRGATIVTSSLTQSTGQMVALAGSTAGCYRRCSRLLLAVLEAKKEVRRVKVDGN